MSYKQMTGNIISATKVEPAGQIQSSAASGVWSLQEQYDYKRGSNWPTTGLTPRGIISNGLGSNTTIEFVNIASAGNSTDFGDLTVGRSGSDACASTTRGVIGGGDGDAGMSNVMDYITISSTGNATDFGNLSSPRKFLSGLSNATRGIFAGGMDNTASSSDNYRSNVIEYITIASTGNVNDFGDLSFAGAYRGSTSSTTRGLFLGGEALTSDFKKDIIEYITIGSTGNVTDFGDLSAASHQGDACSSNTRAVHHLALTSSTLDTLEYVTIASTGDSADFGDLTNTNYNVAATSNRTTGIFCGGAVSGRQNVIDEITIASTGDASDFGDLSYNAHQVPCATSDQHGGLAA